MRPGYQLIKVLTDHDAIVQALEMLARYQGTDKPYVSIKRFRYLSDLEYCVITDIRGGHFFFTDKQGVRGCLGVIGTILELSIYVTKDDMPETWYD